MQHSSIGSTGNSRVRNRNVPHAQLRNPIAQTMRNSPRRNRTGSTSQSSDVSPQNVYNGLVEIMTANDVNLTHELNNYLHQITPGVADELNQRIHPQNSQMITPIGQIVESCYGGEIAENVVKGLNDLYLERVPENPSGSPQQSSGITESSDVSPQNVYNELVNIITINNVNLPPELDDYLQQITPGVADELNQRIRPENSQMITLIGQTIGHNNGYDTVDTVLDQLVALYLRRAPENPSGSPQQAGSPQRSESVDQAPRLPNNIYNQMTTLSNEIDTNVQIILRNDTNPNHINNLRSYMHGFIEFDQVLPQLQYHLNNLFQYDPTLLTRIQEKRARYMELYQAMPR